MSSVVFVLKEDKELKGRDSQSANYIGTYRKVPVTQFLEVFAGCNSL